MAPAGEPLLHLLQEGSPPLPLPPDTHRDHEGWAVLRLRFERPDSAARLLLQLGGNAEVLAPAALRERLRSAAQSLHALYAAAPPPQPVASPS